MHRIATAAGTIGLAAIAYAFTEYRGVALALVAMLGILTALEIRYPKDRVGRKTMHFLGGIGAAFFILLAGTNTASIGFAGATILLIIISKLLKRGAYIPIFSEGIKKFEREGVPPLYGSINFLLGSALATILFPAYAVVGMLAVGVGDSFSTVIGKHFGRIRIGKKSMEGTLAFFATSFFVCAQILTLEKAVIAAAAGAFIELLPVRADDNITIPVGVAGILSLL